MAIGPVQLLVIAFNSSDPFQLRIKRELVQLYGRGIIRFIEGLVIAKRADGTVAALGATPPEEQREPIEGVIGALIGVSAGDTAPAHDAAARYMRAFAQHEYGLKRQDVEDLINGLAPGTGAALMLVEHTWVLKLRDTVGEAGGKLLALGFLTPDALRTVGAELETIMEAESAFDLNDALKGAALLEALEAQASASLEAAGGAVVVSETAVAAHKAAAATETIRVLIVAGLLDEAAVQDALDALVGAGMLDHAGLQHAARLAEKKAVETDTALAAVEAVAQRT